MGKMGSSAMPNVVHDVCLLEREYYKGTYLGSLSPENPKPQTRTVNPKFLAAAKLLILAEQQSETFWRIRKGPWDVNTVGFAYVYIYIQIHTYH